MRLRGISRQMMEETLQRGRLIRNPEISIKTGAWECRMERYVAGQNIGVVAAVSEQDPNLIIVTVMYVN